MCTKSLISIFLATLSLVAGCNHTATPELVEAGDGNVVESLKAGNDRFASDQKIHPRQDKARITAQASGQAPRAVVVSCSDSRVPPEVIFDQGLGDIFSVRSAGQALDAYTVASIEYGVEHLGAKMIVVLGHSSCGAVKTAATTPLGKSTGSENLDELINKIRPGLKPFDPADKEYIQAAKNNVDADIAYLLQKSPLLRGDLAHHKIQIVRAFYHLNTGAVEFW